MKGDGVCGVTSMRFYTPRTEKKCQEPTFKQKFKEWVSEFSLIDILLKEDYTWSNLESNQVIVNYIKFLCLLLKKPS